MNKKTPEKSHCLVFFFTQYLIVNNLSNKPEQFLKEEEYEQT